MEATTGGQGLLDRAGLGAEAPSLTLARRDAAHTADWPHTTRLLPWALVGFLSIVWIVPFDSIRLPFGGPVDMTLDRPLLIFIVGLWAVSSGTLVRDRPMRASPVHWAMGALGLIAALSVLLHGETLVRIGELDLAVKHLALLASYGVFFLLAVSIIRPSEVPKLALFTVVMASITALFVVIENRFGYSLFHDTIGPLFPGYQRPPGIDTFDSIGRKTVFGPGAQPLAVATMLTMAIPFAVVGMISTRERLSRVLYGVAIGLLISGALSTEKKTGLVAAIAAILVVFAYRPRQVLRLAPFAVVLFVVVHIVTPGAIGGVVNQFSPTSLGKVNTVQDRIRDYDAVTPDLAKDPLVGAGYGSYDAAKHRILDNQYLTLGIEVGLFGVLAFMAVMATAFLQAHRTARSRDPKRAPPAIATAGAIAAAAVASALLDFLSLPQLAYLLCFWAAIAVVLARGQARNPAPAPEPLPPLLADGSRA